MEVYDTSPELYPEDTPDLTYLNAYDSNEYVDDMMQPTDFDLEAYIYAIEAYKDNQRYGLPYPGGSKAQGWVWKLAVDCVTDAMASANAQARSDARKRREENT